MLLGPAVGSLLSPSALSEVIDQTSPMTLRSRIPLPGVYGRMDHYGWDSKRGLLIVSALGNNTVEIVDQWRRAHTIEGLEHPQASVYVPGTDRIAVSSQSGKLRFYDAGSYALLKTLDFGAAIAPRSRSPYPTYKSLAAASYRILSVFAPASGPDNNGSSGGISGRKPS